jgi:hypothetical protein
MWAAPSRPSRDESKSLLRAAPKSLQPVEKVVVSKRVANITSYLPLLPTDPVSPIRSAPVLSTRAVPSYKVGKELRLPVQTVAKRRIFKHSVVSTNSAEDSKTYRVAGNIQRPVMGEEP